jgi:NTP pyrophosphatase (non-canonical NTP hydrolase)
MALYRGCLARDGFIVFGGMTMEELTKMIKAFDAARDWNQFHSPKNLAMALSVEVAELVEIFQWMSEKESTQLNEDNKTKLEEEIGDIMIYLTNLSDKFGINPITSAKKKLKLNEAKYPRHIVRGSARKYSEY